MPVRVDSIIAEYSVRFESRESRVECVGPFSDFEVGIQLRAVIVLG